MKLVLSLAVFVCGVLVRAHGRTTTTIPRLGSSSSASTTTHRMGAYSSTSTTKRLGTTVPPKKDPSKYKEQNATKVVEMNATQWVKWRTYNVTELLSSESLQCENFRVMKKITPTNYSLQYRYRSGNRWNTINETLILKDLERARFSQTTCTLRGLLLAYQRTISSYILTT
uniref:Putative lipocalin n=1 Tax=Ixodes ricinus TaxID=34613 RepID=V5H221_IXORI